ncbi:hypothetical protein N0V82_007592 [Gnomoniopsis sp. IMI 355080]|nr:hypothetical protein N0V82_007592 [Gnomoniopsis sp. IMI 355080]
MGKTPFDLDEHLFSWLGNEETKKKIYYADLTDGGWEAWMQFEFEVYLRNLMEYKSNKRVREIQVYDGSSQAADFTLDPSEQLKRNGMIVELKCENKNSLAGTKVATAFEQDMKKLEGKLKTQYQDFEKVAIAMTYSKEAQGKLDAMQDKNVNPIRIPIVKVGDSGLKLKVYRWDPETDSDPLADEMSKLNFGDVKCKRDASSCSRTSGQPSATTSSKTSPLA